MTDELARRRTEKAEAPTPGHECVDCAELQAEWAQGLCRHEQAAWAEAVARGMNITQEEVRALLAAASTAAGDGPCM